MATDDCGNIIYQNDLFQDFGPLIGAVLDTDIIPFQRGLLPGGTPVYRYYTLAQLKAYFAGASSEAVWGQITGTLSNQTDLQNALNAKASLAGATFTGLVTAPNLTVTNPINGSITGNAASVTVIPTLSGDVTNVGNAVTLVNASVTGQPLAGYASGAGAISASDSILQAIQKLNGNAQLLAPKASPTFTGTVTLPAGQVVNGVTLTNGGSSSLYLSADGTYTAPPSTPATTPGGSNGQVQYNNAGAFGGFFVGGDGTLNATTGILVVTKTAGVSFAASATTDTTTTANITDSTNKRFVTNAQLVVIGNTSGVNTGDQTITLTGDVTGSGTGSFATAIGANKVQLTMLQTIANNTLLGNVSGVSAIPAALTTTQVTTLVNAFTNTLSGAAPASGGGTVNFLRADGTWAAPPGATSGTVTLVSVATANGFAGSVANASTTPAITLTTSVTGLVKGNGTALSAATSGTDYSAGTSALATGILKSTTSSGALSIAVAADFPTLNQNTTGSAATLTTPRTIGGVSFNGSANITVASATGGFAVSGGDLSLGANNLTMTGSLGSTGSRILKGWFTDLQVTNAIAGSITGNAATATALATGRTISITGDLAWSSPAFDGSGNVTAAGTLATVNSNVGSFGSATQVAGFTVNAKGLITAASNTTIQIAQSQVTNLVTDLAAKQGTLTLTTTGTSGAATLIGNTLNIPQYTGGGGGAVSSVTNSDGSITVSPTTGAVVVSAGVITATAAATARTLQAYFNDQLYAKDFGAAGDGTTDDTAAIQAALDALNTTYPSGGMLLFSRGTYVASQIKIYRNQIIRSADGVQAATLLQKASSNCDFLISEHFATLNGSGLPYGPSNPDVPSWFGIWDMHIDGNASNQGAGNWRGIAWYGNAQLMIGHNLIINCKGDNIYTESAGGFSYSATDWRAQEEGFFDHVISRGAGRYGWLMRGPHDSVIVDLISHQNASTGFRSETSGTTYVGSAHILSIHTYANTDGTGQYFGSSTTICESYSDFDNVTFATSEILIDKLYQIQGGQGGLNMLEYTSNAKFTTIGTLWQDFQGAATNIIGVNFVSGAESNIIGNYMATKISGTSGITLLKVRGNFNTVGNALISNATGTGSKGLDLQAAYFTIKGQAYNNKTHIVYGGGNNNNIELEIYTAGGTDTVASGSQPDPTDTFKLTTDVGYYNVSPGISQKSGFDYTNSFTATGNEVGSIGHNVSWYYLPGYQTQFTNKGAEANDAVSYQVPTTGFSITIDRSCSYLALAPAGTLATGTITMPDAPVNGQLAMFSSSQTITALTVAANTGQTIKNAPASIVAGQAFGWRYNSGNSAWYLISGAFNIAGNAATATKLATGRTIAITGDLTYTSPSFDGSGNVTAAGTLATVNSNVGSFGSSTAIPSFTVNAKGLITAASTNVVIAPAGTLTGTTLASNVVTSSLTAVGTLATGVWQGTLIGATYGGTGVNNGSSTITLGGSLTLSGAFTTGITVTGTTTVTLPTSGTLYGTATGSITSAQLLASLSDETGTGANVFATSPTLVTPLLGTPTSGVLTNCTGYTVANLSGLGTGVATFLATPSSANLIAAVTDETGTGALVFATSPTLVTPILGTPTSGTLTNCTGYTVANLSGLGTGVATFLSTPSSANLLAAVTDETGTGALVFATSPTLVTPALGTPASGNLANCTFPSSLATLTGTQTLTNKRVTKRVVTTTQSATPTINTDNTDVASITGLAQAITSFTTSLTGTPVDGDTLRINITDNGTGRAITWGASFEASTVALPTTTVASTRLDIGFFWNTVTSKWRCVAVA